MEINRGLLKIEAKASLRGNWGIAIAGYVVYGLIMMAVSGVTFGIGTLLLTGVMGMGLANIFMGLTRFGKSSIENLFIGFTSSFTNSCVAGILTMLFTFLWSLLFVIPGIVKALSYSMTFYILNDHPEMSGSDAVRESMRIMNGHKMDLFLLRLSFIGWLFLCALTCGILTLYVGPYMEASTARFYDAIKND